MIIGNGLIANAIKGCDNEDVVLFASGVSNSVNPDMYDFKREESLIRHSLKQNKLFVYFSTVSIHDESVSHKPYIRHKLDMEHLVTMLADKYLIIRLPNIIGAGGNPNTLFPFFKTQILQNKETTIEKSAKRYLLTQHQLADMLQQLLAANMMNKLVHCISGDAFSVKKIYIAMAEVLRQPAKCRVIKGGVSYIVPKDFTFQHIDLTLQEMLEEFLLQSTH